MASNAPETVKWNRNETECFINLMVENVKKGEKTNSTFTKPGWTDITTRFVAFYGRPVKKEVLRNKMNKLRGAYSDFKNLLDTTGFGWNPMTRTATVDDESVWERALQTNPGWRKFKTNGLHYWPELCIIFGDSYARGDLALGSNEVIPDNVEETEENQDYHTPTPNNTPLERGLDDIDDDDIEPVRPTVRRRLDRTPTARKKRSVTAEASNSLSNISKFIEWKMNRSASTSCTSPGRGVQSSQPQDLDQTVCIDLLEEMPDITMEQYTKAIDRICADPVWAKCFIRAKPDKRFWFLNGLK